MREGGPSFEEYPEDEPSGRGKERGTGVDQEPQIIIARPEQESSLPKERPEDRIVSSAEIRISLKEERDRTLERGSVSPIVIAYPSGLVLELNPDYDGDPSLETFTGMFTGRLITPEEYDRDRKMDMSQESVQQRLIDAKDSIPLQPTILNDTLTKEAKLGLSTGQDLKIVLASFFAVGYEDMLDQWVIYIDKNALVESERNIFGIFHELGHVPYIDFEEKLLAQAFKEGTKQGESSPATKYDDIIKGVSGYIDSIREDIERFDPQVLQELEAQIREVESINIGEYVPKLSSSVMRRQLRIAGDDEVEKRKILQSILTKLSIFAERMADARAAALAHSLRRERNIDLEFATLSDMIDYYHAALDSYAQGRSEPRFHTGLNRKPSNRSTQVSESSTSTNI